MNEHDIFNTSKRFFICKLLQNIIELINLKRTYPLKCKHTRQGSVNVTVLAFVAAMRNRDKLVNMVPKFIVNCGACMSFYRVRALCAL